MRREIAEIDDIREIDDVIENKRLVRAAGQSRTGLKSGTLNRYALQGSRRTAENGSIEARCESPSGSFPPEVPEFGLPPSTVLPGISNDLFEQNVLRIAVQKEGRLTQDTLALLHSCGLEFDSYRNRLFAPCRNFPLSILYGRDDDIPGYVASGTVDAGIVGRNLLIEQRLTDRVQELAPLGFAPCRLVVAVPGEAPFDRPEELSGKRIATTYPNIVGSYFEQLQVPVSIVEIAGSVELAPALGVAEAVADLVATGSSLLLHDLRPVATILESEAVLVASLQTLADERRRRALDRLLLRIRSVLAARRYKYVMMNAPVSSLDDIREIVSGLRMPTVVPLAESGWVAIHTVVDESVFWESIERLQAAGASEILVTPIEKLVMGA